MFFRPNIRRMLEKGEYEEVLKLYRSGKKWVVQKLIELLDVDDKNIWGNVLASVRDVVTADPKAGILFIPKLKNVLYYIETSNVKYGFAEFSFLRCTICLVSSEK